MVRPDNSLVLVDYDSMFVPTLNGLSDEIKGLAGYQHESRWKNEKVSEKADYFSELVIYLSLKAVAKNPSLWTELNIEHTETLLFSGEDIKSKGKSSIFGKLKADTDLAPLTEKLCEFMAKSSIEELCPLEEAVISQSEQIASKWKRGNGYKSSVKSGTIVDANIVSAKWAGGNTYDKPDEDKQRSKLISEISDKFKTSK